MNIYKGITSMIIEQIRMEQIQTYKYLEFEEGKQRVISVCEAW